MEGYRSIRLAALLGEPEAFGSLHAIEASRPHEAFAERLNSSIVFGAEAARGIVGVIGMTPGEGPKDAHKAFVWGFYVEPEWRRQGIGAALLAAVIAAGSDKFEQLRLEVVRDQAAAIAVYDRFGFESFGVAPRSLKWAGRYADEVFMVRELKRH